MLQRPRLGRERAEPPPSAHEVAVNKEIGGFSMRKVLLAALAALPVAAVFAVLAAGSATAKPPGITDVGKKVANFNIILHPNSWNQSDTSCQNNGSRIFYSSTGSAPTPSGGGRHAATPPRAQAKPAPLD
jgi:hypothetical protein